MCPNFPFIIFLKESQQVISAFLSVTHHFMLQGEAIQGLYEKFQARLREFQDVQNQPTPMTEMDSPLMAVPTPAPIQ